MRICRSAYVAGSKEITEPRKIPFPKKFCLVISATCCDRTRFPSRLVTQPDLAYRCGRSKRYQLSMSRTSSPPCDGKGLVIADVHAPFIPLCIHFLQPVLLLTRTWETSHGMPHHLIAFGNSIELFAPPPADWSAVDENRNVDRARRPDRSISAISKVHASKAFYPLIDYMPTCHVLNNQSFVTLTGWSQTEIPSFEGLQTHFPVNGM